MSLPPDDINWIPVHGMRLRLRAAGVRRELEVSAVAVPQAPEVEQAPMRPPTRLPVPRLLNRLR